MPTAPPGQARVRVDLGAVRANWRRCSELAGRPAGAAIKADAYGLGAAAVTQALVAEGCRDLFVACWHEAAMLLPLADGVRLHVLHGVAPADLPFALEARGVQPTLNSVEQAALWREAAPERPCSLMVDTGINRLGVALADAGAAAEGLNVDLLMSHFACADEPAHPLTAAQVQRFGQLSVPARRRSIAASAALFADAALALDLARPGIALYGGVVHPAAGGQLAPAVRIEAQVLQLRDVGPGDSVGYGATWTAARPSRIAVIALGYADGYRRAFGNSGTALVDGRACPVVGRVSMDLTAVDVTDVDPPAPAGWIEIAFDLTAAARASGLSQYELLTGLGSRLDRVYA
ncbi:MAG: alanine racemase [Sphingomonadaceae bacterium]|nr:alanine racemase [Sphingomonadaceae bacterium]